MDNIASVFTTRPWRKGGWRQTVRELFRTRAAPPRPGRTPSAPLDTVTTADASGAAAVEVAVIHNGGAGGGMGASPGRGLGAAAHDSHEHVSLLRSGVHASDAPGHAHNGHGAGSGDHSPLAAGGLHNGHSHSVGSGGRASGNGRA